LPHLRTPVDLQPAARISGWLKPGFHHAGVKTKFIIF